MRYLITFGIILFSFQAITQVQKGTGLLYFDSIPNVDPVLPYGSELAYGIKTEMLYYWQRDSLEWKSFSSGGGFTKEEIEDIVGAMSTAGAQIGIQVTYDDVSGALNYISEVTLDSLESVKIDSLYSSSDTMFISQGGNTFFTTFTAIDSSYIIQAVNNANINDNFILQGFNIDRPTLAADSVTTEIEIFGTTMYDPAINRWYIVTRVGINSEASDGWIMCTYSDDLGATWSVRDTVYVESGIDARNVSGGIAINGDLTIFFSRYTQPIIAGAGKTVSYVRSTDNGTTWGPRVDLPYPTNPTQDFFSTYGHLERIDGDTLIHNVYIQSPPPYKVYALKSGDNGATWGDTIAIVTAGDNDTEGDFAYLGNREIVFTVRRDSRQHYRQFYSSDNGNTWIDQGNILIDTFTNISPMWLQTFNATNDSLMVAMHYYDRSDPSGEQQMKIVYAKASDFKTLGAGAWIQHTRRNIEYNTSSIGYPGAIHPFNNEMAVGWYNRDNSIHLYSSLDGTPRSINMNGTNVGLGVKPLNGLDITSRRNSSGDGAISVGYDPSEILPAPKSTAHIKAGLKVGGDMINPLRSAFEVEWPFGGVDQFRLAYTENTFTAFRTNNIGYLNINPTGGRIGINMGLTSPTNAFQLHSSTGETAIKLTRDATGFTNGAWVTLDAGNSFRLRNLTGGLIAFDVTALSSKNCFDAQGDFSLGMWNLADKQFHLGTTDASETSKVFEHRITHNTTADTVRGGFSVGMEYELENGIHTDNIAGTTRVEWDSAGIVAESASFIIGLEHNSLLGDRFRLGGDGEIRLAKGRHIEVDNPKGGINELQAALDSLYEGLNSFTGWEEYIDTTYRSSTWSVNSNDTVTLRMNGHLIRDMQKPIDIDSMFNRADTTIIGRNGDGLTISIEFDITPTTGTDTHFDIWIDIGSGVRQLYGRTTSLPKGNGNKHHFSYSYTGFTLDTWETNGGKIKLTPSANVDISGDIVILLTRNHKAR